MNRENLLQVRILRCEHYDVKAGTVGKLIKQMPKEGGVEVEVTGMFKNSHPPGYMEEKTVSVFVKEGDYELA
jgi:hypothetical protein